MIAIAAMSATVLAGTNSHSHNEAFTLEAGWKAWTSEAVGFADKASHNMKVNFNRTYTKGIASISISRKAIFNYYDLATHEIAVTTATTGIQYSLTFSNISSGTRYYAFGTDGTSSYKISSFSDTWET